MFNLEEDWERSGDEIFYLVERSPTHCLPPRVQVVREVGARGGHGLAGGDYQYQEDWSQHRSY